MKIGILKDSKKNKGAFLLPKDVASLTTKKVVVNFCSKIGASLNIADQDYINAGAKIFKSNAQVIKNSDILLKLNNFSCLEISKMNPKHIAITMSNFVDNVKMVQKLLSCGVTSLSWECLSKSGNYIFYPIIERFNGYHSVVKAIELMSISQFSIGKAILPFDQSSRVDFCILNCSFAGYEAACQALALGANVTVLDNDETFCKSLMVDKKIKTLSSIHNSSFNALKNDFDTIGNQITKCDVFINTSIEPGVKSKKRITLQMAQMMKNGSILIDASANQGFGFDFEKVDLNDGFKARQLENVIYSNISKIGQIYSTTYCQIISEFSAPILLQLAQDSEFVNNEIINDIIVTKNKKIVNEKVMEQLNIRS